MIAGVRPRRVAVIAMCLALGGCGANAASVRVPADAPSIQGAFRMTPAEDQGELPATRVQFVLIWPEGEREVIDVGVYVGACHLVGLSGAEIAEAECWWGPRQVRLWATQRGHIVEIFGQRGPDAETEPLTEVPLRSAVRVRSMHQLPHMDDD